MDFVIHPLTLEAAAVSVAVYAITMAFAMLKVTLRAETEREEDERRCLCSVFFSDLLAHTSYFSLFG